MSTIGFVLSHEQFTAPQLLDFGVAAEQAGFDAVWTSDHFHPWMDNQGHAGQAWITLAALGQRMPRIPFGTAVTCPTYRYNPVIVAQAFASLGVLYPGRVFLGVGSGEALNEQPTSGDWGDYEERADRWIEAIELIRKLWTGDWVSHKGQYYTVEQARIYDLPQQPTPIYMAAEGPKSMYKAGYYGDGLITDSKSAVDQEMRKSFEEGARAAGKNPANMPILAEHFMVVGGKAEAEESAKCWRFIPNAWTEFVDNPDPRDILRKAEAELSLEDVYKNWLVSDDPEEHAQSIQQLIDAGVTQVYVHSGQYDQQRVIDFYGKEVLPRLHGKASKSRGA
jgi:TAT-translocated FGD2 family F420-dependent dehydrogenase